MWRTRLAATFPLCLLVLTLAGPSSAQKTYRLCGNSGGQLQEGRAVPLPLQPLDADSNGSVDWGAEPTAPINPGVIPGTFNGPGATVFPPLRVGPGLGATLMDTAGGALTIPAGVLVRAPAMQATLGINATNPQFFAVATNLTYKWPATSVMLAPRAMTTTAFGGNIVLPSNATTVFRATSNLGPGTAKIRYVNGGQPRFGGSGRFTVQPNGGQLPPVFPTTMGPIKTSVGITRFALTGSAPPCAMCFAALVKGHPKGMQAVGAQAFQTVATIGGNVAAPDIYSVSAGAAPKGTILNVFGPVGTGPAPTDMASSSGFFWTTGRLTVSAPGASGGPERFVLQGSDARLPNGEGTIQLVAGALAQRSLTGARANRGWIRLNLKEISAPTSGKFFQVIGTSDAKPWNWRLSIAGDTVASATNVGPVAGGSGPAVFVDEFVASINANAGSSGCTASEHPTDPEILRVDCTCDFEFWVTDEFGTECQVTGTLGGAGCPFNPTIVQVAAAVPALQPWGLLALSGSLLLTGAFLALRRRRTAPTRAP